MNDKVPGNAQLTMVCANAQGDRQTLTYRRPPGSRPRKQGGSYLYTLDRVGAGSITYRPGDELQATLPLTDGGVLRWKSRAGATYQFGRWLLPPRKVSPGDPDSESNVDQRVRLRMQGKEENVPHARTCCRRRHTSEARGGNGTVPPARESGSAGRGLPGTDLLVPRAGRRGPNSRPRPVTSFILSACAEQADHEGPVTPQANRLAAALATHPVALVRVLRDPNRPSVTFMKVTDMPSTPRPALTVMAPTA